MGERRHPGTALRRRWKRCAAIEDPEASRDEVRELQQQWRQAADVPRAQGEALWRRFKAAHDELWARCEAHFAAQAEARAANLAKKIALCETGRGARRLDATGCRPRTRSRRCRREWKAIGPVSRGQEKAIWERFRVACDQFFTRRHEDLAERKAMLGREPREEGSPRASRPKRSPSSTEWDAAAAEIKRLQNEWKTIGPVKKSRSEAIWQRFRGACDAFFARYAAASRHGARPNASPRARRSAPSSKRSRRLRASRR